MYVDFNQALIEHSAQQKKRALIKACKPKKGVRIIDATAGWGRDAGLLAAYGAKVLMIERSPLMGVMLEEGLSKLSDERPIKQNLSLHLGNAIEDLPRLCEAMRPHVIYLDPMHPQRTKKALVKKNMQALQSILGADEDAEKLLEKALSCACPKVVMKWPKNQPSINTPSYCITGKTVRLDVYVRPTSSEEGG